MLNKVLEYESKEEICGNNRNLYFKTENDATAMCFKSDYYFGLETNIHAAYNVQILVIKGLVFSYHVSQFRTDFDVFIKVLTKFYENYNTFPKRVCADAGYGILKNYKFFKDNNIENYVKNQTWEGNVSGSYLDCSRINNDNKITCLNNLTEYRINIKNRHPRNANTVFYKNNGCNNYSYKSFCKRFMKVQDKNFKIFEVVTELQHLKLESMEEHIIN